MKLCTSVDTRGYRERVDIVHWPRLRHILWLIHRNPVKPSRPNKRGRVTHRACGVYAHTLKRNRELAVSLAGYHADCRPVEMRLITCYEWVRLTVATAAANETFYVIGRILFYIQASTDAAKIKYRTTALLWNTTPRGQPCRFRHIAEIVDRYTGYTAGNHTEQGKSKIQK